MPKESDVRRRLRIKSIQVEREAVERKNAAIAKANKILEERKEQSKFSADRAQALQKTGRGRHAGDKCGHDLTQQATTLASASTA